MNCSISLIYWLTHEIDQYFQVADHIVVLEDHRVRNQGNWHDIKISGAPSAKLSSSLRTKDNTLLSANFENLDTQLRAKDEIEIDLSRKSGDPALYGSFSLPLISYPCD
jgi:ABC-type molybdate transport system ATPase subunit